MFLYVILNKNLKKGGKMKNKKNKYNPNFSSNKNFLAEELHCKEDEVFVDDRYLAPASVSWVKKKRNKVIASDKIIFCDRCKRSYARYLDNCHPFYDDFTLCERCHAELYAE